METYDPRKITIRANALAAASLPRRWRGMGWPRAIGSGRGGRDPKTPWGVKMQRPEIKMSEAS